MKKLFLFSLTIVFLFTSCSKFSIKKKSSSKRLQIKKINSEVKNAPVFEDIEKYIRTSYYPMDQDEIRRETFIRNSSYLDIYKKDLIQKGKIEIGMYKEEVFASIGTPLEKKQSLNDFGIKEEWKYNSYTCYFQNGILKSIN